MRELAEIITASRAGTNIAQRKVIASAKNPINGGPTIKPKYEIPEIMATASAGEI